MISKRYRVLLLIFRVYSGDLKACRQSSMERIIFRIENDLEYDSEYALLAGIREYLRTLESPFPEVFSFYRDTYGSMP